MLLERFKSKVILWVPGIVAFTKARRQSKKHAGKHKHAPDNTYTSLDICVRRIFLVINHSVKAKEATKLFLQMRVTISGTHGSMISKNSLLFVKHSLQVVYSMDYRSVTGGVS
jgi:hypothetical protein